jgi:tRNA(fMet)-specific endonuclease VapC
MAMIVADSDVLIDALAGVQPSATLVARGIQTRRLAIPAIVHFELLVGTRTPDEVERVRRLLRPMVVLPFDKEAAELAASAGRRLVDGGRSLPMADLAIAGICLSLDVPLLTRRRRHFERIDGLRLEPLEAG